MQVNRTYSIYWNGAIMFLPAGRHPYISVLKQMDGVETSGIIFNSFVTNGFFEMVYHKRVTVLVPLYDLIKDSIENNK